MFLQNLRISEDGKRKKVCSYILALEIPKFRKGRRDGYLTKLKVCLFVIGWTKMIH